MGRRVTVYLTEPIAWRVRDAWDYDARFRFGPGPVDAAKLRWVLGDMAYDARVDHDVIVEIP